MEPRVPSALGPTLSDSAWKFIQPVASNYYCVISEGCALINLSGQESQGGSSPAESLTSTLSVGMEGGVELEIVVQSPRRPRDLPESSLIGNSNTFRTQLG